MTLRVAVEAIWRIVRKHHNHIAMYAILLPPRMRRNAMRAHKPDRPGENKDKLFAAPYTYRIYCSIYETPRVSTSQLQIQTRARP